MGRFLAVFVAAVVGMFAAPEAEIEEQEAERGYVLEVFGDGMLPAEIEEI